MSKGVPTTPTTKLDVRSRVFILENTVNTLAEDLRETNHSVKQLTDAVFNGFSDLKKQIEENKVTTEKEKRANWPMIIGIFTPFVSILGWFVISVTSPIERDLKAEIEKNQQFYIIQQREIDELAAAVKELRSTDLVTRIEIEKQRYEDYRYLVERLFIQKGYENILGNRR